RSTLTSARVRSESCSTRSCSRRHASGTSRPSSANVPITGTPTMTAGPRSTISMSVTSGRLPGGSRTVHGAACERVDDGGHGGGRQLEQHAGHHRPPPGRELVAELFRASRQGDVEDELGGHGAGGALPVPGDPSATDLGAGG